MKEKSRPLEREISKELLAKLDKAEEMNKAGMKLIKVGIDMGVEAQREVFDLFEEADLKKCSGIAVNKITGIATLKFEDSILSNVLRSMGKTTKDPRA